MSVNRAPPLFFSFFFFFVIYLVCNHSAAPKSVKKKRARTCSCLHFSILTFLLFCPPHFFFFFDLFEKQKRIIICTRISIELAAYYEDWDVKFIWVWGGGCGNVALEPAGVFRPETLRAITSCSVERILIHTVKVLQWFTICTLWITNTF